MTGPRRRGFAAPKVSRAKIADQHLTWLQALPGDGPFLTVPVLTDAFPVGLEPIDPARAGAFKRAYADYRTAPTTDRDQARDQFIATTVREVLDWGTHYDASEATTARFTYVTSAFGVTTTPAFAQWPTEPDDLELDDAPVMLGFVWPYDVALNRRLLDGWATSPIDRAAATLRHHNVPLGLVTNGRSWVVLWAPRGSATGWVLFDTHAMLDDRQLLDAFATLLTRRRHLAVAAEETLVALLNRALQSQEELTENLSTQVRKAVEMLVEAIGRADRESDGWLLTGVDADEFYEGAVTIVMRLVFLLAAEERRLLPGDDALYAANYGIAGLADRLIAQANTFGEDFLARQSEGFPQVLAASRVVHDGVRHQTLNIKGYGGSVFDPHRHPWLEGAQPGGTGQPAHVDDRTMLHILKGLTRWQGRRLAYRTLDVEQIGYFYEGLLDHTALRADAVYLGLRGGKEPEASLDDIEAHAERGEAVLAKWLKDATGLSVAQVKKALAAPPPEPDEARALLTACHGDTDLADRITGYLPLLRADERTGAPIVFHPGDFFVTRSEARSGSGAYYTPRSLAEEVVTHTLDALVYDPGPLQTLDEDQWRIVPPATIIDLNVADIAMGSGAFLVAADRYLADKLLDAVTTHGLGQDPDPALVELDNLMTASAGQDPNQVDTDADEATVAARRLVASRCLYGVDINPNAVEMAKLSLWLATAANDQPFGFLDHRLTVGDSLLGLTDVRQLEYVHPDPGVGVNLHTNALFDRTAHIRAALQEAIGKRRAIEAMRIHDLRDVEQQQALLAAADRELADLGLLADAITAEAFAAAQNKNKGLDQRMLSLGTDGGRLLDDATPDSEKDHIRQRLRGLVDLMRAGAPEGGFERNPTQWIVRFPEIMLTGAGPGFDAILGNPPYLGGQRITGAVGTDYRNYLVAEIADGRAGSADLVVYFLLQAARLSAGRIGLITTNTIGQGDSRAVGLEHVLDNGWTLTRAERSVKWPSHSANVEYSAIYLGRDTNIEAPRVLDGDPVRRISSDLRPAGRTDGHPQRLAANADIAFQGSIVLGMGFTLSEVEARAMIDADPRNAEVLFPYLNGQDLNQSPTQTANRWVINFFDWPVERASAYTLPFAQVERLIRPERLQTKDAAARFWWRYLRPRAELYGRIAELDDVIAITLVSSVVQPVRVPCPQVFTHALGVFASDSPGLLGLIASGIHGEWARKYASSLETRVRYTPTDVFETFPLPPHVDVLDGVGSQMEKARQAVMESRGIGLTSAYNAVNDEMESDAEVLALRQAHMALDRAVLNAYGWGDLDPHHGFYGTEQGVRFTMEPSVTVEVLDRLLELNHERYAHEVARELHGKQANQGRRKPTKAADDGGGGSEKLFV